MKKEEVPLTPEQEKQLSVLRRKVCYKLNWSDEYFNNWLVSKHRMLYEMRIEYTPMDFVRKNRFDELFELIDVL